MKLTRLACYLLAALCLAGARSRGEDAGAAAPQLEMTLIIPHEGDGKIPRVPWVDHSGRMLHAQVVLHNLSGRALTVNDYPDGLGPYLEMRAADGKSWVRLSGVTGPWAFSGPMKTLQPGGRAVLDVYFHNAAAVTGPGGKITGRVVLRAVFSQSFPEKEGESGSQEGAKVIVVWEGDAASAPVVCEIE